MRDGPTIDRGVDLAVVVPTYRRPELLRRCLDALCAQSLDGARYEVIVADDDGGHACAARTRALVAALDARTGGRPRVRWLPVTATQGPAGARNVGWRASNARVVAFTDDDTIPDRAWLAAGLDALDGGLDAAGGTIVTPLPTVPTDYERDAAAGRARAEFAAANVFVSRAALGAVGGFDERFTAAWREDSDLHFALLRAGYRVGRATRAVVVHPVRPAPFGVSLSQQKKAVFDALLFKKHAALYRERIRRRPPWDHYGSVAALLGATIAASAGARTTALVLAAAWLAWTARSACLRLSGTSRRPSHVLEMLWTSIAIPPLAIGWRLVGALRYRVAFL